MSPAKHRTISRRTFLGVAGTMVPGLFGLQQAQDTAATRQERAGKLYNPNMVQRRQRVTDYDNDEYIKDLERQLKCSCGCNLDIYTCRTTDFTCETSPASHRQIVAMHEAGMSAEEILADFVERYGEEALMAPKPEGFNLAGYLVPGILVSAVGALLAFKLLRHRPVPAVVSGAPVPSDLSSDVGSGAWPSDATPEELERLQRELEESGL